MALCGFVVIPIFQLRYIYTVYTFIKKMIIDPVLCFNISFLPQWLIVYKLLTKMTWIFTSSFVGNPYETVLICTTSLLLVTHMILIYALYSILFPLVGFLLCAPMYMCTYSLIYLLKNENASFITCSPFFLYA